MRFRQTTYYTDRMTTESTPRSGLAPWVASMRLRTLPLALAGSLVAGGLAKHYGVFRWPVFILMVLTAALLQILSDFANDYGDFDKGADGEARLGPKRGMQRGLITKGQMKNALFGLAIAAFCSGIALIVVSLGLSRALVALLFVALGGLAIGAALKYTMGRGAYGYRALGDLAVFLFFGIVSVCAGFYLYAHTLPWPVILPAISVGALSTAVLNLNNMRDMDSDKAVGKTTLAVLLGPRASIIYHAFLLDVGVFGLVIFSVARPVPWYSWIYLLGLVPLVFHMLRVLRIGDDRRLYDPELKRLSLIVLFITLLFAATI